MQSVAQCSSYPAPVRGINKCCLSHLFSFCRRTMCIAAANTSLLDHAFEGGFYTGRANANHMRDASALFVLF